MSSLSPIEDLTKQITANAKSINEFLCSNGHLQPSFDRYTPITTLPRSAPQVVQIARHQLIDAELKIQQLAIGPSEYLPNLAVGFQYVTCLRWLCHFKIFSHVPLHGSVPYCTVAEAANVSEARLKSVARMAMTDSLFYEASPNYIAHSATSTLLVANPNFHDWAVFMCESSTPTAAKFVEATERWPDSSGKMHTAYNIAFDTDLPFFDHLACLPERTRQFASYMRTVASSEGSDMKHLLNGFDWRGLGKAKIVDVGGSMGHASIALAKAFPDLNFVVQDLLSNATEGEEALASSSLPENVSSRITFQGHDFFELQPIEDADVYLLRMILHDWPDNEAVSILFNTVTALGPNVRIIIMDTVLPRPGSIPASRERLMRVRDLTMMQAFNSKERALEDWTGLLERVDQRPRLVNVTQPFGSVMSALEVVLDKPEVEVRDLASCQ